VVDRLTRTKRDVAVSAAERAGEVEGDLFANGKRAVRLNSHEHVGGRERVGLRRRGGRPQERGDGKSEEESAELVQVENCTVGASRVTPSASK
jgi:hypothetical protein